MRIMTNCKKCSICSKKISLVETVVCRCRCDKLFCNIHRIDHKCTFDYKEHYKNNNTLVKIIGDKINPIC